MEVNDFDAIRISLASPEQIRSWSYGEVLKPETINYRTLRPERDGLFCERIFGPTRDWECACGKYKRPRYKGVVCEKCGVEVAPSRVRRERMGHIELASPVSHIWYVKGVPSRLGLLLDISPRNLERVLYFAQYIVTKVDEQARAKAIQKRETALKHELDNLDQELQAKLDDINAQEENNLAALQQVEEAELAALEEQLAQRTDEVMKVARDLQAKLEQVMGKALEEDLKVPWDEVPIFSAGTEITRQHLDDLNTIITTRLNEIERDIREQQQQVRHLMQGKRDQVRLEAEEKRNELQVAYEQRREELRRQAQSDIAELKSLNERDLLPESQYRELKQKFGGVFEAGMGAEAILEILKHIDLDKLAKELRRELKTTRSKQRRKKAAKRLRVVEAFRKSGNKPEWMILTVLPVIPPDLRPMVQLDGGRFATSDLNDLYRRVINRNNRLKRLLELQAPDVIIRNEKRMLQEAVDSLIDNGRRGRAVSRSGRRKLKSLSDMLKGKQGRFRRNLLGKRVDYSGRSVIVVGPELKLHECGLPKKMALELYKPFVMRRLVALAYAHNIKSAKRLVDREAPEVWDVLEDVVKERPVLLNRAPTLHRLGIQAFEVRLIDGYAIQLHPLVCAAFNADFDGDQMAVHVPLSEKAVQEARELMLSTKNLLKPASGEPIVGPSKDMVLGTYYLTVAKPGVKGTGKVFASLDEVRFAYELGHVHLHAPIKVWYESWLDKKPLSELGLSDRVEKALLDAGITSVGELVKKVQEGRDAVLSIPKIGPAALAEIRDRLLLHNIDPQKTITTGLIETTVGRVIFNLHLPEELRFVNDVMDKKRVNAVVADAYQRLGPERTAEFVDVIKDLGFYYATKSGTTIAISDIRVPEVKTRIIEETTRKVEEVERQYRRGLITEDEQYLKTVELWTRATDEVTEAVKELLDPTEGLGAMSISGSTKGGIQTVRQLAGMRGLMADPSGRIIPLPIRSNFREGLTALEFFLSTHGARKGLADTALRTADAGYLTRRLVDVAQDVIITEEDCGTASGIWIDRESSERIGVPFVERIMGRIAAAPISDPETGEILVNAGDMIEEAEAKVIDAAGIDRVYVRSPLACQARFGLCRMCYGRDLARGGLIQMGEAVGIIAAQSIGEPGTQLTLRTFHTGGVAGTSDITQGLPRVEELFEARVPRGEAVIAEIDGRVEVWWEGDVRKLRITNPRVVSREIPIPEGYEIVVSDGDTVTEDTVIARSGEEEILAGMEGTVYLEEQDGQVLAVVRRDETETWETEILPSARLRVEPGSIVKAGDQLTEGAKNPKEILRIQGPEAAQMYLLEEVQKVYRSQGVVIHDKHIEIIIRQMMRKVRVRATGDTEFLPGELVDRFEFERVNSELVAQGKRPARGEPVLLGITKASLNTESFLAAASFQETTRVLTDAAVRGARDDLRGLKENVIIGKLIPAGTGFRARLEAKSRRERLLAQAQAFLGGGTVSGDGDGTEPAAAEAAAPAEGDGTAPETLPTDGEAAEAAEE